jgi:IS605 OrfB family transposase
LHRRIRNIRQDFLHKVTTELAKAKPVLVVEDLNVRGLARNGSLSRAILDVGWGAFRRMLEYKCAWYALHYAAGLPVHEAVLALRLGRSCAPPFPAGVSL